MRRFAYVESVLLTVKGRPCSSFISSGGVTMASAELPSTALDDHHQDDLAVIELDHPSLSCMS